MNGRTYRILALWSVLTLIVSGMAIQNSVAYHSFTHNQNGQWIFHKWFSLPINFVLINPSFSPDGQNALTLSNEESAKWNSVEGAKQMIGSITTGADGVNGSNFYSYVSTNDRVNDIVIDGDGSIFRDVLGLDPNSGILGLGYTEHDKNTGEIFDGILFMNATVASSKFADFRSTFVHEMGHVLGLAHSTVGMINDVLGGGLDPIPSSAIPTMYPFSNPTDDSFGRTLEYDDFASLRTLYPQ